MKEIRVKRLNIKTNEWLRYICQTLPKNVKAPNMKDEKLIKKT